MGWWVEGETGAPLLPSPLSSFRSPVRRLRLQVLGQVDDHDGVKGAFLRRGEGGERGRQTAARRPRLLALPPSSRTLTQMPHPMQSSSEIHAILDVGPTSMQSLPGGGRVA